MLTRRDLFIGAGLATSGAIALLAGRDSLPQGERPDIASLLPERLPPWDAQSSEDAILSPDALSLAIYEQLIARRYTTAARPPVTMVTAFGPAQSYATQLHRPEICYPASGFEVLEETSHDFLVAGRVVPASILVAKRGLRSDSVLYWARLGSDYPRSLWEQRRAILGASLSGSPAEGVLVRFSCRTDVAGPIETLEGFAHDLWNNLSVPGKKLFFGFSPDHAGA